MFHYTIRESFSQDEPWVRRIAGFGRPWSRTFRRGPTFAAIIILPLLAVAQGIVLFTILRQQDRSQAPPTDVEASILAACGCLILVAISLSFLAGPIAGWEVRRALTRDRLFGETTHLFFSGRDLLVAIHGRILLWTALAMACPAIVALEILAAFLIDHPKAIWVFGLSSKAFVFAPTVILSAGLTFYWNAVRSATLFQAYTGIPKHGCLAAAARFHGGMFHSILSLLFLAARTCFFSYVGAFLFIWLNETMDLPDDLSLPIGLWVGDLLFFRAEWLINRRGLRLARLWLGAAEISLPADLKNAYEKRMAKKRVE